MNSATGSASSTDDQKIHRVIDGYYSSIASDPLRAASFYGVPALLIRPDKLLMVSTRAELEAVLVAMHADMVRTGYASSHLLTRHITCLNPTTVLYEGTLMRLDKSGTEMGRGGVTYLLYKGDNGWKMHAVIATTLQKAANG